MMMLYYVLQDYEDNFNPQLNDLQWVKINPYMEVGKGKGQGTMTWDNFHLWKQQTVKCLIKDDRGVTQVTKYNGPSKCKMSMLIAQ